MKDGRGKLTARELLVCRVGNKVCGLPLEHVRETMRPLPLEPLGHMPSFVSGLSVIRGQPTPVLDSRVLLGAAADSPPTRYVTLVVGSRSAALAVDGVLGVHSVAADALASLPAVLSESNSQHVSAVGMLDTDLLVVLQHAQLVPEALWQELEKDARPA